MHLNIAHRGARSLAPENTMAAIRKAHEVGADLWETDISVTADGHLILFHDDDVLRTTDATTRFPDRGDYRTSSFTLEEIRSLDAGSWFRETDPFGEIAAGRIGQEALSAFEGEKIPTLAEGLAFTKSVNWPVNLEIKKLSPPVTQFPMVDRVLEAVAAAKIDPALVIFSSFFHPFLDEIRQKAPAFVIQALIGDTGETEHDWVGFRFDTYNANQRLLSAATCREVVAMGKTVNVYTVNPEEKMRQFMDAGATGIITDFPQNLKPLLDR